MSASLGWLSKPATPLRRKGLKQTGKRLRRQTIIETPRGDIGIGIGIEAEVEIQIGENTAANMTGIETDVAAGRHREEDTGRIALAQEKVETTDVPRGGGAVVVNKKPTGRENHTGGMSIRVAVEGNSRIGAAAGMATDQPRETGDR